MHALAVRQLTKIYKGGHQALKGVGLRVEEGDFFALLGPNGAGKSTLIGIVCSLVNKTAGSVEVFGHDLDREPEAVKSCLGMVPLFFPFLPIIPLRSLPSSTGIGQQLPPDRSAEMQKGDFEETQARYCAKNR